MGASTRERRARISSAGRRHILSHLDFDHAGGLDDFPHARVHLLGEEIAAATARRTMLDRMRYRPQQWGETRAGWQAHRADVGEPWFGFDCVRDLPGVGPDVLMVPLLGHTLGHAGVAVRSAQGNAVEIFCAHDVREFERLALHSHRTAVNEELRGRVDAPVSVRDVPLPMP